MMWCEMKLSQPLPLCFRTLHFQMIYTRNKIFMPLEFILNEYYDKLWYPKNILRQP